jgi:hypothetical protein
MLWGPRRHCTVHKGSLLLGVMRQRNADKLHTLSTVDVTNVWSCFSTVLYGIKASNTIEETMDVIHTTGRGRMLNVIEKYCIYKETAINNQINDRLTVTPNVITDTILRNVDTRSVTY